MKLFIAIGKEIVPTAKQMSTLRKALEAHLGLRKVQIMSIVQRGPVSFSVMYTCSAAMGITAPRMQTDFRAAITHDGFANIEIAGANEE